MTRKTIIILSSVAVIGTGIFFALKCSDCGEKCDAKKGTSKTERSDATCNSCGKTSCTASCEAGEVAADGKKLKGSLPSCNLSADQMVERRADLGKSFVKKIKSVKEIDTGFQLTFKEQKEYSEELLEFINIERDCCSSFSYALIFEPNNKAMHLQIYGSKEIKEEIRVGLTEMGLLKS